MFQCCWKPGPHFVKKENNMQRWGRGFAPINSIISLNSAPALPFLQFFPFFFFWFKWHQAEFLSPQLESRSTVKLSIPKGILLTKISSTCCCHPFAPPHPHSARRLSCSCLWVPLTLWILVGLGRWGALAEEQRNLKKQSRYLSPWLVLLLVKLG